jgi:hypothetical protein
MAKDLIPPPSPAGRPEPETSDTAARSADGLWSGGDDGVRRVARAPEEPAPEPQAPRRHGPSPYHARFGFVVGALIGVVLAAIGLGALLAVDANRVHRPDGWSAWHPSTTDDLGAAKQIADHVGPRYRLGDSDQLVAVQSSGLEVLDRPLSVVLRSSSAGGNIELLDGHGVMYTLNGLGQHGSIAGGKPSEQRHLLLRREALELALYTFHYAHDVDMVVALLPPPPPEKGQSEAAGQLPPVQALFYRPGDLKGELGVPLTATIPDATPSPGKVDLEAPEYKRLDSITRSNLFEASFQQGQDANVFLVLQR